MTPPPACKQVRTKVNPAAISPPTHTLNMCMLAAKYFGRPLWPNLEVLFIDAPRMHFSTRRLNLKKTFGLREPHNVLLRNTRTTFLQSVAEQQATNDLAKVWLFFSQGVASCNDCSFSHSTGRTRSGVLCCQCDGDPENSASLRKMNIQHNSCNEKSHKRFTHSWQDTSSLWLLYAFIGGKSGWWEVMYWQISSAVIARNAMKTHLCWHDAWSLHPSYLLTVRSPPNHLATPENTERLNKFGS